MNIPRLSKSGLKTNENCDKKFFYHYYMYPDDRYESGIEAVEGSGFHEYGEMFDDAIFYDGGRGDESYWKSNPVNAVRSDYANQYIRYQQLRREILPKNQFLPFAKEVYIELDDIRGFIDYLSPVYVNDVLIGISIGEIKPSRKNYAPKYLRSEMSFYYILLTRGLEEGGISEFYFDVVNNDYKRDEYGDPIPYPYTIPRNLDITHWEAYYYKEPIEQAHWVEKIGKTGFKQIEKAKIKIAELTTKMKNGGRYPLWTRQPNRRWFSNPLCPKWCDYSDFCNPYHDGYVCIICGFVGVIRYDEVHVCEESSNRK